VLPLELTVIAVSALFAGLLVVGFTLARRGPATTLPAPASRVSPTAAASRDGEGQTLRVVWWLTITIVLLGVGISGSFSAAEAPIFVLGGMAAIAVLVFHELFIAVPRGRTARLVELVTAIALVGGLLTLTGYASSPFAMLFALIAVAAALGFGARAGIAAAVVATVAFGVVLAVDPALATYRPADVLRLSFGLGATWLLAFVAVAHADRQRRAMERTLELSRTDPLTGLRNRSDLFATLEQEVSRTRRSDRGFCLLMIDLDGLKAVNDSGGHLRGDQVLRSLGTIIATSIRAVDSAYRYGGDEFVVLLPETDIVGAFVVAEKIRIGAEELDVVVGEAPRTSVSIGLVSHPEDGLTAEELMVAADRAMYQAKSLGKNQISGNPRPRPALLARRSTLDEDRRQPVPVVTPEDAVQPESPAPAAVEEPRPTPQVAVELGPIVRELEPEVEHEPDSEPEDGDGDDTEPDAQEVRRRIATASRSFDPDDQVRRAMDAFFSPSPRRTREERASPEH
jgi:diguanylate cyclase (GGDEF)-like protein